MFKNLFIVAALTTLISLPASAQQLMKAESPTKTQVNVQADAHGNLYTTPAVGAPATPVIIQDPTNAAARANVAHPSNVPILPAGVYAEDVNGFGYCFDAATGWNPNTCTGTHGLEVNLNYQSLTAVKISKDGSANAVADPIWCEISNGSAANAQATPMYCAVSKDTSANAQGNPIYCAVSKDTSANAQGNPIYCAVSKDTSANAQGNPIYAAVSKDTSANAVGNPIFCELSNGTAAFMQGTSYPGYVVFQDVAGNLPTIEAPTLGMSAATKRLDVNAIMQLYNGATYDPAYSGPNHEVIIYVNNWPSAFDAANNRVNTYKTGSKEYNPPAEGPTAVNAVAALVLTAKQIINYPNVCIWVKNAGGGSGGPFTDVDVQVSPDNSNWVSLGSSATCDGLTTGLSCQYCLTAHANNWIQVYVTGTVNPLDSTADAFLTSNAN